MAEEEKTKAEQDAALSNLSTEGKSDASTSKEATSSASNQAALNDAISKLSFESGKQKESSAVTPSKTVPASEIKKIKLNDADITFIITHLELKRPKAEQLLRQHDGDRQKAIRGFVLPNAKHQTVSSA